MSNFMGPKSQTFTALKEDIPLYNIYLDLFYIYLKTDMSLKQRTVFIQLKHKHDRHAVEKLYSEHTERKPESKHNRVFHIRIESHFKLEFTFKA